MTLTPVTKLFAEMVAQRLVIQSLIKAAATASSDPAAFVTSQRAAADKALGGLELVGNSGLEKRLVVSEIKKAMAAIYEQDVD